MNWLLLGNAMILATGIMGMLFVVVYGVLAPWWRNPGGRNIFAVMLALAANAIYFGWIIFFVGHVPRGFYPIRALLFTALFLVILHRVILLIRVQIRNRRASREVENTR